MGDNIYLGDRDGVRTPMQWNADRNAGFSVADPQTLYLPLILDPVYGYQALNVDAQMRSPTSLLNWTRKMLGVRRQHPVFGMGTYEELGASNPTVLAFVREFGDDLVLCVNNLSRFPQPVELDLARFEGYTPVELTGRVPFPPHRGAALPAVAARPRLLLVRADEEPVVRASLADPVFTEWLTAQRWFGGKGRTITRVSEASSAVLLRRRPGAAAGRRPRRLRPRRVRGLPAAARGDRAGGGAAAGVRRRGAHRRAGGLRRRPRPGAVRGAAAPARCGDRARTGSRSSATAELDPTLPGRMMTAEQSNTSVVYGDELILKLFRRLQPGANPDIEVTKALADAGCTAVARPMAWMDGTVAGEVTTLGLLQPFLKNSSDGWADGDPQRSRPVRRAGPARRTRSAVTSPAEAERLGATTGEVHLLMAQVLPSGPRARPSRRRRASS